jgi:N-acetylglucosaminyldiphosphoundecaprenol N-acetyl-beta-D-mannosaminyltransferase
MKKTVCGIAFDDLTMEEAVRRAMREDREQKWVATPNALMLSACRRDPALRDLIDGASMVLADGVGVLWAARKQGTPLGGRIAGIDFAERVLHVCAARGERVFFLGGRDDVARLAANHMQERIANLNICGCYWGYFEKSGEENQRVLSLINAHRPSVLFVCFGFPEQELWIRENLPRLGTVRLAVGLGGSFDVWAGQVRRAPKALQACRMEWAWRMVREPRRMAQIPTLVRFCADVRREQKTGNLSKKTKKLRKMHKLTTLEIEGTRGMLQK